MARSTLAVAVATTSPTAAADAEAEAAIIPTKKAPLRATVPDVEEIPARRPTRAAASTTARSTPAAADSASDDDSDYKAAASLARILIVYQDPQKVGIGGKSGPMDHSYDRTGCSIHTDSNYHSHPDIRPHNPTILPVALKTDQNSAPLMQSSALSRT